MHWVVLNGGYEIVCCSQCIRTTINLYSLVIIENVYRRGIVMQGACLRLCQQSIWDYLIGLPDFRV